MSTDLPPVPFTLNHRPAAATAGSSVAAAVLANGVTRFRQSVTAEARAPLCGMGICFECRLMIDGQPHQKSCQIVLAPGMVVETPASASGGCEPPGQRPVDQANTYDLLVVGAGPGGIAATVTAAEAGRRVALVDDGAFAGGQIWRHRSEPTRPPQARRWLARLNAVAGSVTWLRQSRVIAQPAPFTLLAETPDGPRLLRWQALLLATGARELFLPFPGWTLPGVFGAGALQALVKQGLPVRGQRVVVAGTGPLLLAVAALLRSEGAVVPIIFEQARPAALRPFAWAVVRSPSKLLAGIVLRGRLLGVRYATDSYPVRVTSCPSGLHVEYRAGRRTEAIDCDYLACGFGLIPNTELPQLLGCRTTAEGFVQVDGRLATTVPHVYALGELTGIGGVDKALIEGCLAAHAAAGDEPAAARLACDHAAAQGFTRRLAAAFTLRPELRKLAQPDTIICRCEDVPLSAIEHSLSGRDAKLQTRCGMGPCQGRVCGPILQQLLGAEPPQIRPPLFPTAVGTLAAMFPTATS